LKELEDILHAHYGNCMKHQIRVLLDKSLIKIDQGQWSYTYVVTLHALIEKMGKEIVREESPKVPGRRSRLWFHRDIIYVLEENKVNNTNIHERFIFYHLNFIPLLFLTISNLHFVTYTHVLICIFFSVLRDQMKLKLYI